MLLEKEFFGDENFRKIKKKLFYQIAEARIQELSEIMISKNVNLLNFNKTNKIIFLRIEDKLHHSCFCDVYSFFFSHNNNFKVKYTDSVATEDLIKNANQIVHFGWKKEAVPVIQSKRSLISRFFDTIFR